jgi:hypothetical protein
MIEDRVRDDIAWIRGAIEEGQTYAARCGPDLLVWGVAIAIGHLGTYAFVRGWSAVTPNWLWSACIGLPWLYSLRSLLSHRRDGGPPRPTSPAVMAVRMLWLGCGIFLTTMAITLMWSGEIRLGWFNAVAAGVLGIGVFATAWLANLPWLRWVAIAWWIGELALYALRHQPEALLLSAVLMLALLAGPGLVLVAGRRAPQRS